MFSLMLSTWPAVATPETWPCNRVHADPDRVFAKLLSNIDTSKWPSTCADAYCRALKDLFCAAGAHVAREYPNSQTYDRLSDLVTDRRGYDRAIQALGRTHPARIPLYCTMLTRVAAQVNGDPSHDERSIYTIIDLALRLDRPGQRCTARIKAAFPQTEAVQSQLPGVGGVCLDRPQLCYPHMDPPLRPRPRR